MKNVCLAISVLMMFLTGCVVNEPMPPGSPSNVGSDRDERGCIGSAGYRWCARTDDCERPWELAEEAGFANSPGQFEEYCKVNDGSP